MKKILATLVACLLIHAALYPQCTPNLPSGNPGLLPAPSNLPCIDRGVPFNLTLYFENFTSFSCGGFTADVVSSTIDNLANLPCGLSWQADRTSYAAGQTGCIQISGTSTDLVGQYPLEVYMSVELDIFGSSYTVSGSLADLEQQLQSAGCPGTGINTAYYSRVVNPGTACPAIGSLPNSASSGATCPAMGVTISGNLSICAGNSTTLTANVTNSTGTVTYSWSTGAASSSITVSPTSTTAYAVTVTDQNGSDNASVTVTVSGCDDSNACTTDNCVPGSGCVHTPITCDDGDACTTDACNPSTGCTTAPIVCNDGDACMSDGCDPLTGCTTTPVTCNDGDACTADGCDPLTGCTTTPITCNDGDACTIDDCDALTGCTNNPVVCDDGDICTTDACTGGQCVFTPIPNCNDPCDTLQCDDSDLCTADSCANGQCENTAVVCNDGDTCTADACDAATGCVFTPISGCATGVEAVDFSNSLEIYPNPSSGVFEVAIGNKGQGDFFLKIFDLSGKNLLTQTFSADGNTVRTIDAREFPKGIYVLNFKSKKISVNKKLVIY